MKALTCAMILLAGAALAQDSTPFSQQPYRSGADAPLLGLGDMMAIGQMRHIKLWQAARAENWPLASYEADKLRDSLYRAATFYVNIPVSFVKGSDEALAATQAAATRRDARAFEKAFGALTMSCNACHQAAGLDFVRMRTPSASPFSNQDFAPVKSAP